MAVRVLKGEGLEKELARPETMTQHEKEYEACVYICGIDEAGRGPLTGPVAVGAMILSKDYQILYLNDSKKLSEERREELFEEVKEKAATQSVGIVLPARTDEISILQTTYEATRDAAGRLGVTPDVLLNDAITIPGLPTKQVSIIEGDTKSFSIAAASVLAKVTRGHMMAEYGEMLPGCGFAKHKNYGTAAHIQTVKELGSYPIHRRLFIRNFIEQEDE